MPHPIIHILKFTAFTVCVAVAVGYVLLQPMQTHEGYTHQNHKEKNNTFEEEEDPLDLVRNLNQPSDFHSLKKSLMEMGFEETLVEKSLKDFNNDLNLALDWLEKNAFDQPKLENEPLPTYETPLDQPSTYQEIHWISKERENIQKRLALLEDFERSAQLIAEVQSQPEGNGEYLEKLQADHAKLQNLIENSNLKPSNEVNLFPMTSQKDALSAIEASNDNPELSELDMYINSNQSIDQLILLPGIKPTVPIQVSENTLPEPETELNLYIDMEDIAGSNSMESNGQDAVSEKSSNDIFKSVSIESHSDTGSIAASDHNSVSMKSSEWDMASVSTQNV
ncbi:hypothetical protein HDV02_005639 [Globomyces sp. JEL0801]|nr:hypothetical protein HDV02_005639 [Globomyces sp. JEL0801]